MKDEQLQAPPKSDALPESATFLSAIFSHCHDAIFVLDPSADRILSANPRACNLLGYTREELLAAPISGIHPDDTPSLFAFVQSVLNQGHGRTDELACLTRIGEKIPAEISASVIDTERGRCVIALVRDIRERKRAEQALRENQERLASILDTAMDAIVTVDQERNVTLFNKSAEEVFERPAGSVVGLSLDPFLTDQSRAFLEEQMHSHHGRESASPGRVWAPKGLTFRRAGGEEFPVEASMSGLVARGNRFYTLILRDVHNAERAARQLKELQRQNIYLREEVRTEYDADEFVGSSPAILRVLKQIRMVAPTDSGVLLVGETGTGKELLADAIHRASNRRGKLLVKVNCAALPGGLVESELFGYEKGAFTGAGARKKGRFELADGGTIFLDEVGELTADAQAKLLRVLQQGEFVRLGGTRNLTTDVRIIAATNVQLSDAVAAGRFRPDLYYRLSVFPVTVPPLRERRTDIPPLARHFLRKAARKLGKPVRDFSTPCVERLLRYPWPGNVRELQNVVERAAILSNGPVVEVEDALELRLEAPAPASLGTLQEVERAHILRVLQEAAWVIEGERGAAAILDLHPNTLRFRMRKLGLKRPS